MGEIILPMDDDGTVRAWKVVIGGKHSHEVKGAAPFPDHRPNWSFDKGVKMQIKDKWRITGPIKLP